MDPRPAGGAPGVRRFPRERGDGPLPSRRSEPNLRFPPRARGWTPCRGRFGAGCPVSPASAGMDRRSPMTGHAERCFPRERGDGPPAGRASWRPHRFPPRARGWTIEDEIVGLRVSVSPASAGMDPGCGDRGLVRGGFPRERGDGPLAALRAGLAGTFPPRARGWTAVSQIVLDFEIVSPASAGMDLRSDCCQTGFTGFPRERGDGPHRRPVGFIAVRFPPRARGWT